jgi:hypothetical protein
VRIRVTAESSSFPSTHILTPDDGHIGRNLLWILNFGFKVLKVLNF